MPAQELNLKQIIEIVRNHGFLSLTSREFEVALKKNKGEVEEAFKDASQSALTTETSKDWNKLVEESKKNASNFSKYWDENLRSAANERWSLSDIVKVTKRSASTENREIYTLKTTSPNVFFDRLFHADTDKHKRANSGLSDTSKHRDLFDALKAAAAESSNFEKCVRAFIGVINPIKDRKDGIPHPVQTAYMNIFKSIFIPTQANNTTSNEIIDTLKKYAENNTSYDQAREKHLEEYEYEAEAKKRPPPPRAPSLTEQNNANDESTLPEHNKAQQKKAHSNVSATLSLLGRNETWFPAKKTGNGVRDGAPDIREQWVNQSIGNLNKEELRLKLWGKQGDKLTFTLADSENSFEIDESSRQATIQLTATRKGNNFDITLTRTEEDKNIGSVATPVVTWHCNAGNNLTEEEQFKLIAAESLALRIASGMNENETKKIGIVTLDPRGETAGVDLDKLSLICNTRPTDLSMKETQLIKAHLDAGYTEVWYNNTKFEPKPPALGASVTHYTIPSQSKDTPNSNNEKKQNGAATANGGPSTPKPSQ